MTNYSNNQQRHKRLANSQNTLKTLSNSQNTLKHHTRDTNHGFCSPAIPLPSG